MPDRSQVRVYGWPIDDFRYIPKVIFSRQNMEGKMILLPLLIRNFTDQITLSRPYPID